MWCVFFRCGILPCAGRDPCASQEAICQWHVAQAPIAFWDSGICFRFEHQTASEDRARILSTANLYYTCMVCSCPHTSDTATLAAPVLTQWFLLAADMYCGSVFSYMSTCQHASHASHGDANVYSAVIVKTARKTNLYSIFFNLQKKDTLDYRRVNLLLNWGSFSTKTPYTSVYAYVMSHTQIYI